MSYEIRPLPAFERDARRLIKKYPSLTKELSDLGNTLAEEPEQGEPLGRNCFKIRIAIASKAKGKSGGGRLITHVVLVKRVVYLLSIYDKSERSTISRKELTALIAQVPA